jgi:hypothetical protein
MSQTAAHANSMLQLELANVSMTGSLALRGSTTAGNLTVSLWRGDPDASGVECDYTGYARASLPRSPSSWVFSGREAALAANLDFPRRADAGTAQVATWIAVHDQDGTRIRKGQITTPSGGLGITQNVLPQLLATLTKISES